MIPLDAVQLLDTDISSMSKITRILDEEKERNGRKKKMTEKKKNEMIF